MSMLEVIANNQIYYGVNTILNSILVRYQIYFWTRSFHYLMVTPTSTSTQQRQQRRTYAQIVASKRVSLVYKPSQTQNDENETITIVKTHIYQRARTQGALLFDFSSVPLTADLKIQMLREQHPNCFGLIAKKERNLEYLEVYIDNDDDDNDICETGVYFHEQKIRVLSRRAIYDASQIVHLNLSDLPMLRPVKVLEGITKSLEVFGDILDIGLNYDPRHNFYMGTGYAVLDLNDLEGEVTFQPLSHTVSWCESTVEDFHVTWKNMPTWCRYCHEEGHTKFNCEKSKARIICYNCHEVGH
ncbi:hypothetical protein BDB01DRAFT_839540, partial [Pilobolus umbonatus]